MAARWRKVKADMWSPFEPRIEFVDGKKWFGQMEPNGDGTYTYFGWGMPRTKAPTLGAAIIEHDDDA